MKKSKGTLWFFLILVVSVLMVNPAHRVPVQ